VKTQSDHDQDRRPVFCRDHGARRWAGERIRGIQSWV
jgi:hypothetical protein